MVFFNGTKVYRKSVPHLKSSFLVLVNSSHGFLSAIFGIFGKFCFDIAKNIFEQTFFSRWKIFLEKSQKKYFENFQILVVKKHWEKCWFFFRNFSQCFFYYQNLKIFKIFFWDFFKKIFHLEKKVFSKIFFAMSKQNFPKIPKIALRKACDEFTSTYSRS